MRNRLRTVAATLAAVALCVPVAASCGGDDGSDATRASGTPEAPEAEQPLSQAQIHGRELFVENCGSCHTLDAAGTFGQIGPNLDDVSITEEDVRRAIRIGGRGSGNMPSNLVTGKDAQDVASFVAASASGSSTP